MAEEVVLIELSWRTRMPTVSNRLRVAFIPTVLLTAVLTEEVF